MTSVYVAFGLFTLAAILGAYLLSFVLQGQETPKGIAFIHGPLALTGIISLFIASYQSGWTTYKGPLALFILAAMGGTLLITIDLLGWKVPKTLGIIHGAAALSSFVWLLVQVFGSQ